MWVFLCQKYGKFRWSFSSSTNPQIVRSVCIHKYTSSQSWRCYRTFKNSKIRGKKWKWRKSSIFNLWSNPSPHQITILVSRLDDLSLESLKKICGCGVGCSRCWSVCVTIIFVTGHRSTMCSGPPTDMAMMFADIMGQVTDRKKA